MSSPSDPELRIVRELDGISPRRAAFDSWFLGAGAAGLRALLHHWLLIANLVNALLLLGAVAVPLMRAAGWGGVAGSIFSAYRLICFQNPEHSYFLLGYQLAMDQRMMALYGSSLLAGLAFVSLRNRLPPLPWRLFFLMALPIALDGFTQLFGWRQSGWELRTLTGGLFGVATVWLAYPHLDRIAFASTPARRDP